MPELHQPLLAARHRHALPQLGGKIFVTDGGIETTLIYQDGINLPYFAAFDLLRTESGRETLKRYYRSYGCIARARNTGFVLESATWRANDDWGRRLGYTTHQQEAANYQAIAMLHELRPEFETPATPVVISGCIGPRGDGYKADQRMSAAHAADYHHMQAQVFRAAGADFLSAITMTYAEEATGIVSAAQTAGLPVVISFTVETNGRLPSGQPLADAIAQVDAATGRAPAYYMVNCAHPTHFAALFEQGGPWVHRIRGLRANASARSHAELDAATELDAGDPADFGRRYRALRQQHPHITVLGGCCGTDHRHIGAICAACIPTP